MMPFVSPAKVAASLTEFWSPRIVGEVDDAYIKVAKVHGQFTWHAHQEMEGGTVELKEGKMFVMPKGVRQNPIAEQKCLILLIERKSTLHTGDVVTAQTRTLADQLRPVNAT